MTHTPTDLDKPQKRAGWVGWGTASWSLAYAALGLFWWRGGAGFPFGTAHDPAARGLSLLEHARPETTGPALAVAGLCGAALAVVLGRSRRGGLLGGLLAGTGWAVAGALAVVIPDYRPLLAVVRAPMLLIGAPFGWPEQVRLSQFFGLFLPWPVLNQILFIIGGVLWAATVLAYRRRVRAACGNCGRTATTNSHTATKDHATTNSHATTKDHTATKDHAGTEDHAATEDHADAMDGGAGTGWTTPAAAARWGRWAVAIAVTVPIGYSLTRWAWALDIPLGVSREGLHQQAAETPGIWLAGAMLATMGAGGALLTIGLVRPWGEVYPQWIPYLRGKRVRPRTAIVPATAVALLVTSAGLLYLRRFALGHIDLTADTWGLYVPEFFWPVWGGALGAATLAYHLRRRGRCLHCGRL